MAWVQAEAAMPLGWRLMALVRQTDSDGLQAMAAGPLDGCVNVAAFELLRRLVIPDSETLRLDYGQ